MATGTGIDAIEVDGKLVGRTALDDRLLTAARYHNFGIVMGCSVRGASDKMAYVVSVGSDPVSIAVASRGGSDGASEFPVPSGEVATTAAPASGARIDVIWAKQNDPDKGDPDNQVVLGVTQGAAGASPVQPQLPEGAVLLRVARVPAGITAGSQASLLDWGDRAIPYGGSLGELYRYQDTFNGKPSQTRTTKGQGTFTIPTPRRIDLVLRPTISTPATDNEGSVLYRFIVDGQEVGAIECGFNRFWQTYHLTTTIELQAGRHTISYTQERRAMRSSMSDFVQRYGLNGGNRYLGTVFTVEDRGVA